ncbi:MAG: glycine cleavage system protein GcvH [Spirochaetes bacterium]|nr:MAG: glycine cleavage system protein GcvH [Spirochaetota bacterium]
MKKLLYSKDHTWVRLDGERAVVGISDFAQDELGEIVYVELPEPGSTVKRGDIICTIDSLKSTSEIYSPVSGTIEMVNDRLKIDKQASIINKDPTGEGWLLGIILQNPEEMEDLLTEADYKAFLNS